MDSTIEQITISDHAPVTLMLSLPHQSARAWHWKLNENLLDDLRVVTGIEETLTNYFTEDANREVTDRILWEGHKAVVQNSLIAWGSKLKKERQADFQWVFGALQQVKLGHKHTAHPEELRRLTDLHTLFSKFLDRRIRRWLRYVANKYYEYLLANVGECWPGHLGKITCHHMFINYTPSVNRSSTPQKLLQCFVTIMYII